MGLMRPRRVERGRAKNAKNQYLVIFGIPDIQLEISFWGSIAARVVCFATSVNFCQTQ